MYPKSAVSKYGLAFLLVISSAIAIADDWTSFTTANVANPSVAGIYWQTSTNEDGDLQVTAAIVDNMGNVVEVQEFDEEGQAGVGTNNNEPLGEYVARTEGETTSSGFFDPNDPFSDPFNCDFHCGEGNPFGEPGDTFGGN